MPGHGPDGRTVPAHDERACGGVRINIDDEQMLPIVRRYRIRTVPTLLLFHRGEERWRRSGTTSYEEMVAALEQTEALIHATPH